MKKIGTKLISSTLLFSILAYSALPVMAYTKEESVYSKLDSNGMVYQTTVSNHLKNTEKSELLNAYPPTTETKSPKFPLIISHLPNNLFFVNL